MSEYFEFKIPRKSKKITPEQRRKYTGKSFVQIEKDLNGLPYEPDQCKRRQRTIIENNAYKLKNLK